MKKLLTIVLALTFILLLCLKVFAIDDDLVGTWELTVQDINKGNIATLVVKFTPSKAESCLGGYWRKLEVISSSPSSNSFYPNKSSIFKQELSYKFEDGILTLGRNNVCDAYVHLTGELINAKAEGKYVTFGWGREHLGYFSIQRTST